MTLRLLLGTVAFALCLLSQVQGELQNPQLTDGSPGAVPTGWFVPSSLSKVGYYAELTEDCSGQNGRCVVIGFRGAPDTPPQFGNLMQNVSADQYRGKRVRFSALARSGTNKVQLWLRADLDNKQIGFFDNMQARPITSTMWQRYEIVGDIEPNALSLALGAMTPGVGTGQVADFRLEILGDADFHVDAARPLSPAGLRNLTALAKLYGYVRYFHPAESVVRTDWEEFLTRTIPEVEPAKDAADLAARLSTAFAKVAPLVQVYETGKAPPTLTLQGTRIVEWQHKGIGLSANTPYRSQLVARGMPEKPIAPIEAALANGVQCRVPRVLAAPETLPVLQFSAQPGTTYRAGMQRFTRLAGVILAWNIFQHFYPYFDVVETDWPAQLTTALRTAATDGDETQYSATLRRLVAALHDGHGFVSRPGTQYAIPPVRLDRVGGKFIVVATGDVNGQQIERGDEVTAIDGRPVAEVFDAKATLVSAATPQFLRVRLLEEMLRGPVQVPVSLDITSHQGPEVRRTVVLNRTATAPPSEPRPEPIKELEPGTWYVDLTRINDQQWSDSLPQLAKAKGIVFDMRGYPGRLKPGFLQNLSEKPMTSAQWHIPNVTEPDHASMSWSRGGEWDLTPKSPYLPAKKAFLTDGQAISYAESCMGIVEAYRLGEIVGEATAGTNGNVNPFTLPGGYRVGWTGMKVLKHDGSRHHGVGIAPTIPVARTRASVIAGKDEYLDRALQAVR